MAKRDKTKAGKQQPAQGDQGDQQQFDEDRSRDWADEAAEARTSDDPRARAPHDALGVPSTGGTR